MIPEILLGSIIIVVFLFIFNRKPEGLPPGEWGWPIIGYLPSPNISIQDYVEKFKEKYGKTFTWKMGSNTFVFLCDYNVLKTALNNPLLSERPEIFSLDIFTDMIKSGFSNSNGLPWQNVRRFSLRHLRDLGMGKSTLEDTIMYEIGCLLKDFKKHTNEPTTVPMSLNVAMINTLWMLVADKRYEIENEKIQKFQQLLSDIFFDCQDTAIVFYDFFPWLSRLVPLYLKKKLGIENSLKRFDLYKQFMQDAIDEHKETLDVENPRDLIDSYLIEMKLHEEGKGSENTSTFNEQELRLALADLFGAGSESTSSTIRWIIYHMVKYPDVQKKVQEEIDNAVERDRLPTLNDKEKLKYTEAVCFEVMRMRSISPLSLYHSASEDTMIDDFRIPKGTVIVSGIGACHFDPDYWENPSEFLPERFIQPDGTLNNRKEGFLPFSIGRRVCPGESLAKMEIFLFVSAILQNFTFEAAEGEEISIEPDPKMPFFSLPKPCKLIISERK